MSESDPLTESVLVVTSMPTEQELLAAMLADQGYLVCSAATGQSALELAQVSPPGLILLDVRLPDLEGYEVCVRLKADPRTSAIPVLLIEPEDRTRALEAGAADYVARPLQKEEVFARVETHLTLARLTARLEEMKARVEHETAERIRAERTVQESTEAGRNLIDSLNEVIYAADERGTLTYISPGIERFLGYPAPDVIGHHVSEFIHSDDLPRLVESMAGVLAGRTTTNEYRAVTRSGEIRWMRTSSQPAYDGDRIVGAQGVLMDITGHKQAEEQMRQQNEFLKSVIESLTHPFYVVNASDYSVEMANSAARAEGLAGSVACYAFTHGQIQPCATSEHPCPLEEVKKTRKPVMVEHCHYAPNGAARNVEVYAYPLLDRDGNVDRVIEYSLDVTERKQAEEALRRSEKQYRQLLETLQEGIWVIDADAHTTFVNPRMAEMLGYTVEEMQGKHLFSFMDEHGIEIATHNLQRRQQGIREQHDFEFLRKDGTRIYALLETSPILADHGTYMGAIAGVQDITLRREAVEALRRSESLLKETQRMARLGGWELDLATHQVFWTEEVYRIHELPLDFDPWLDDGLSFYPDPDRQILEEALRRAAENGEPWDLELQFVTAKGRQLWVRAIGSAEAHDGQVERLSGTFQDITERKEAELALRQAKELAEKVGREEAERRREAERRHQVAESLAGAMAALNSNQSLDQVLDYIAGQARQVLNNQAVAIFRMEDGTDTLTLQTVESLPVVESPGAQAPLVQDALKRAVASCEPVVVCDVTLAASDGSQPVPGAADALPVTSGRAQYRALLALPIVVRGEVYGGIVLYYDAPRDFSDEEADLAMVFGHQVALAIENARLSDEVKQAATAAERSRLARDLHDSVTQALFSASLVAEVMPQVWRRDPAEALQGVEELRLLTRGALAEMRTLLLELRPGALVEARLEDLLRQLTDAVTGRAEISVKWDMEPIPALPPEVQITFYRVAQEALHNVVKHSGASQVTASLRASPPFSPEAGQGWQGRVILCIGDDGQGFDPEHSGPDHIGLSIMYERAAALGATLRIQSQPGHGTEVTLVWENSLGKS